MIVVIEIFQGVVESVWGFEDDISAAQEFTDGKRRINPQGGKYEYVIELVKKP